MKVKDLIKGLKNYPEDATIVFSQDEEGNGFMKEADLQTDYFGGKNAKVVVLLPYDYAQDLG